MVLVSFNENSLRDNVAEYVVLLLIVIIIGNTFLTICLDQVLGFLYPIQMREKPFQSINLR